MSRGIWVALSGAVAQENSLETTATNVANASTLGYQRLRPVFREALASAAGRDPTLHFGTLQRTALDMSPGAVRKTDRALDAALPNGVYLAVSSGVSAKPAAPPDPSQPKAPDAAQAGDDRGERYTRAASLTVDKSGDLKTNSGSLVLDVSGAPIHVNAGGGEVRLHPDGSVVQQGATLGKLKLVRFEKPDALVPEGNGRLAATYAGSMTPAKEEIQVGAVEESNAEPVLSMTEMMMANRTFEAFQRILDTLGEDDRKLLTTVPIAGGE